MLFTKAVLDGIAEGRITVAYRRWDRPRAVVGGRQRTRVGVLAIERVEPVDDADLTDADARAAGLPGRAALLRVLDPRPGRRTYRVDFRLVGEDPRIALREDAALAAEDIVDLRRRLARLDAASRHGPWTEQTLDLIAQFPGRRAPDLAELVARPTQPFKTDVRKLKELGLTESLPVGYRLSPRGRTFRAARPA